MTEGLRINFVMREALFSKFTRESSVFHTYMRNKQVEFNPYNYIFSQLSRFGYEISVFKNRAVFRTAAGAAGSYVTLVASWKNGCQNFSFVYRSRKHQNCKYPCIITYIVYARLFWVFIFRIFIKPKSDTLMTVIFSHLIRRTSTCHQYIFKKLKYPYLLKCSFLFCTIGLILLSVSWHLRTRTIVSCSLLVNGI